MTKWFTMLRHRDHGITDIAADELLNFARMVTHVLTKLTSHKKLLEGSTAVPFDSSKKPRCGRPTVLCET
jgi:hypothetical protein